MEVQLEEKADDVQKKLIAKDALKSDLKRAQEIWAIKSYLNMPHDIVHKAIYEDVQYVDEFVEPFWITVKSRVTRLQ